jgi:hypothetical protein
MEATKEKRATFTPGPWGIQDAGPGTIRGLRFRVITDEKIIAKTSDGLEEARANARLIAAAPELLEQCKLFEKVLTYYYGTARNTAISATANDNLDKLREVLAKVEGGEG